MMLRTKFYLGLLPLLILLVLMGVAGIFVCNELAHSSREKISRSYAVMLAEHEMREAAGAMATALHTAMDGRMLEARPQFETQSGRLKKALMEQSFSAAGTPREKAIGLVSDAFGEYEEVGEAVFASNPGEMRASYVEVEHALFGMLHALDELLRTDARIMQAESERIASIAQVSVRVLVVVIIAGIVLSVVIAVLLARLIVMPVSVLTTSVRALGEGNLDGDVAVTSGDELGMLARTFNTMSAKLREYRDAMTARVVRAQRTMEATLTSTPDPLFVISPDSADIRNPAAEKLAALPEFANGLPEELARRVSEVLATKEHFLPTGYGQVIAVHVDRDEHFYLPRILYISDKLTGAGSVALLLQDVTKFRLLDDAKNNLVGTVSHELKTPLTSLRMAVYLLLEQNTGALAPKQRDLLETARDDADRLLRILNDILDLARIESGTAAISRREVEIRTLLEEMAREMSAIAADAGQRIVVRADGNCGARGRVFLDPDRIRHVFVNLLGNASKYSPPDSEITLYAEPDPDGEPGAVRFGVRDRGTGISEKDLPYVFQKFYRVPGQTRKGAGLGLSIAREVVLAHGGTIACASKIGEGSDFHFTIPPPSDEQ